jgi:hypothetical protein
MVLPEIMQQNQISSRAAYSPAEFAASCGRHPTWTYRLLYRNKLKAVTELGRILIPASELERVLGLAAPYNPKAKARRKLKEANEISPEKEKARRKLDGNKRLEISTL